MQTDKQKWELEKNYTLDDQTGYVVIQDGMACTLHFGYAFQGDRLKLLDERYEYKVATYDLSVPLHYIYTYDYQQEQNWSTYRGDLQGQEFTQGVYCFAEEGYFRIVVRQKTGNNEWSPLESVIQFIQDKENESNFELAERCARDTFEQEIRETAEEVRKVQQRDTLALSFLLCTDTHYTINGTWQDTIQNMRCVSEQIRLDGILHLGDSTDGMLPKKITTDYVQMVFADIEKLQMPFYYILGNHDYNYFRSNPQRFSEAEMRSLYLNGKPEKYYYQDFEDQKLRMIFLDSFLPERKVRYGFSEEELDWLEVLLEEMEPEWFVLVCSHVPPVARLHYWSDEIYGSHRLLSILKRYQSESGGRLLGFINGHNHADAVDYGEGFPVISIGCTKCEYFTDKKPEDSHTWERELHTVSQDLWDVMTISVENRTIDFTRFGAGENRHIMCTKEDIDTNAEKSMKKVITYGTYDLFHEGHYRLLKRAKELGDYLIVGVTTEHYDEQRGKINIVDSLLERIENVRKTGLADEIIIEDHEGQKVEDIQKYGVDIFTLGSDWRGMFDYLKAYCQVVYLERTPGISSTMLRNNQHPIIRMGIVGTGRIAPRFLAEAKYVSGLNVSCVYNPHRESAERFAKEHEVENFSNSFEEFLGAVDAIYIATPHETHYDYAKRALLAGKHVLCEKPLVFTKEQAKELFGIAHEKNIVLMEGIKTAYCPGFAQLISIAKSGKIGEIRDVEACFSRLTDPGLREMVDARYGGAFLEFGSYTVLPIIKLLGLDYECVEINSILAENMVDLYTKIQFRYPNGLAMSKTGIGVKSEGQLLISGTKGYILAESPWWLTRKFQVRYEDPNKVETYTPTFIGDGLRYEIGDFLSCINGSKKNHFKLTEAESVAMADVVERFMEKRERDRQELVKKNRESGVAIWAHRGCSYRYPENTLPAFQAACELEGLAGIELDVQLTKDEELVVFHDEAVDRLMDSTGNIRDYTLAELQRMCFKECMEDAEARIPALEEVLQLVKPYAMQSGLKLNIELKNNVVPYEGMEEKVLHAVGLYGMNEYVVYSSFNPQSIAKMKKLDDSVQTGILQGDMQKCIEMMEACRADALHPKVDSIAADMDIPNGVKVRAWNSSEPFYKQDRQCMTFNLCELRKKGVTDLFTNVPEEYL